MFDRGVLFPSFMNNLGVPLYYLTRRRSRVAQTRGINSVVSRVKIIILCSGVAKRTTCNSCLTQSLGLHLMT